MDGEAHHQEFLSAVLEVGVAGVAVLIVVDFLVVAVILVAVVHLEIGNEYF